MIRHTPECVFLALVFAFASATPGTAREQKIANDKPIPARIATIQSKDETVKSTLEALAKQTGLEVDFSEIDGSKPIKAAFDKAEFWKVVDAVAEQSGSRVAIGQLGKAVRLVPNTNGTKPIISVDGPFRIAAREIDVRRDLISGNTVYDLTLEVAWEARLPVFRKSTKVPYIATLIAWVGQLPVFRMDKSPTFTKGEDNAGHAITVNSISSDDPVDGVRTLAKVQLDGITRDSKQIQILQGSYLITAAEEMLRFRFDDLVKLPSTVKQGGVSVHLNQLAKSGIHWNADIELSYPPDGPFFESFQTYWLRLNRITLVSPDGKKFTTDDDMPNGNSIRYRFKESAEFKPADLKGWKLEYETPGAMREVKVKFELKGIALP